MRYSDGYKVKVNFIRHGRTASNDKHLYISTTDEGLSVCGREELKNREYPPCEMVFTSGYKRCKETSETIYKKSGIIEIPNFAELDFGDFEGKGYEDLKDDPLYQKWLDDRGESAPPNGESRAEFVKRLEQGFLKVLDVAKESAEISLVVHGGTIMGLVSRYTKEDYYKMQLKCGEYISCMVEFGEKDGILFVSHFCIMDRSGS